MTAPDDVRARFEAWMCSIGLGSLLDKTPARHDGSFEYISAGTQHRWLGYRAAHADMAGEVRELAEEVIEAINDGDAQSARNAAQATLDKFAHQETK